MITASYDQLLRDSCMTADTWLDAARRSLDEMFGPDYAKKNPALVGVFMRCAADDFINAVRLKVAGEE